MSAMGHDGEVRELNESDFAHAQVGDPSVIGPVGLPPEAREHAAFRRGIQEALRIVAEHKRAMDPQSASEDLTGGLDGELKQTRATQ